jgi:hypothetical protein
MDGTAALLTAVSLGGLIIGASLLLLLLREQRGPWVPQTAEGMQLLGLAVMAAADIASGARYGLLGAIISAWPAVAFFGGGHGAGVGAPLPQAPSRGQARNDPGGAS